MGDGADEILDGLFDHYEDCYDDEQEQFAVATFACKHCHKPGLVWVEWKSGRYAPGDSPGILHHCDHGVTFGPQFFQLGVKSDHKSNT